MKKIILAISALTLALGISMPAYALTQTSNMPVSVTLVPTASVLAGSLSFGSVTPSNSATATTNITVNVGSGTPYTVTLNGGLYSSASTREVRSGATIGGYYWLWTNSAMTTEWGDGGFAGTYSIAGGVTGTGTGANQSLTVYGEVASSTTAGTFSDTVTVTVNY